jgi:hypothetical protein
MARKFLTVLTTAIAPAHRRAYQRLRRSLRPFVKPGVPRPATSPYPGHFSLVRSVVEGLRAINADFNFNPRAFREVGRAVYAPTNEALRQAAALKRQRRIEYLVAGPVNALFPASEEDGVLLMPEIDGLIIACEWARQFYEDEAPHLLPKLRVCPVGVDVDVWKPSGVRTYNRILVYWKSGSQSFCEQVEDAARRAGFDPVRVRSGHGEHELYDSTTYRRVLDEARFAIFLSSFETQGLALLEAWSMDVPTVVWDPRGEAEWRGRTFRSASSCPYLTASTGRTWRTLDELASVLKDVIQSREAFHPRQWVVENMTDAICATALYDLIKDGVDRLRPRPNRYAPKA